MARRASAHLPPIGAHLSTAGGPGAIVQRVVRLGVDAVQIFNTNPRTWKVHRWVPEQLHEFGVALAERGVLLFVHAIYLINLATPDEALRRRSLEALAEALLFGAETGAAGVVVHVGSHQGAGSEVGAQRVIELVAEARQLAAGSLAAANAGGGRAAPRARTGVRPADPAGLAAANAGPGALRRAGGDGAGAAPRAASVRASSPGLPTLLLENSPGGGRSLGRTLEELAALRGALGADGPSGICLDSAHLYAAGFPVHTPAGLERLVHELDRLGLLDDLRLIHLNDCKSALGSLSDRHANLGEGMLGMQALTRIVREPAFRRIPFVMEVPGEDGHGPDLVNVRRAQSMRPGPRPRREPPARREAR